MKPTQVLSVAASPQKLNRGGVMEGPTANDDRALQRDLQGGQRDDAAGERTLQADMRDIAAARFEDRADKLLASTYTTEELLHLLARSLRAAFADRSLSAADRRAAAEDRYAADRDRRCAAADREHSAADRQTAARDPLTGAHTRAAGFQQLRRQVDQARQARESLTLVFLDVDGLKAMNDAHGHAAGDRALIRVVEALRTALRPNDLVMRFGGDEFLCALMSMDDVEVARRLGQVSSSLDQAKERVSVTVGLASLGPVETIDELFRRADAAFYDTRRRR